MDLDEYLAKLRSVLATRRDLVVVARTDSSDPADIERRIKAFAEAGADAVSSTASGPGRGARSRAQRRSSLLLQPDRRGQVAPPQNELREAGISLVIYSTPCLFAAQAAMEDAMLDLKARNGTLAGSRVGVKDCTAILQDNLARRNERS